MPRADGSRAAGPGGRDGPPGMFQEFLRVLWRFKWSVGLAVLNVLMITVVLTLLATPTYHAGGAVLIEPLPTRGGEGAQPLNMITEAELLRSNLIAQRVVDELDLETDPELLAERVQVNAIEDTEIIEVGFTAASRADAQERAQAFIDAYLSYRDEQAAETAAQAAEALNTELDTLQQNLADVNEQLPEASAEEAARLQTQQNLLSDRIVDRQLQLAEVRVPPDVGTVLREARADARPASPDPIRNVGLGIIGGLALGLAIAAVRDQFDDRVRDAVDLQRQLDAPLVMAIPGHQPIRHEDGPFSAALLHTTDAALEAYRALTIEVGTTMRRFGAQSLLVTGVEAGAGASTIAAAIAVTSARAGQRVILVSADVRNPAIETMLRVPASLGLVDVLEGQSHLDDALRPTSVPRLLVLPAGSQRLRAPEMLAAGSMSALAKALENRAELVIYDTAPVGTRSDVLGAAQAVRAVLLVGALGTRRGLVADAESKVRHVGAEVVAGVLTGVRLRARAVSRR